MTPDDAKPGDGTTRAADHPDSTATSHGHDTAPDGGRDDSPADAGTDGGDIGSVAEEAALLVDLLSRRGWGGDDAARAASPSGPTDAADTADTADAGRQTADAGTRAHECTCGGRTPAACRICPVCQLISFVQQISPESIERVADVVELAATALRDLATAQRERHEPDRGKEPAP